MAIKYLKYIFSVIIAVLCGLTGFPEPRETPLSNAFTVVIDAGHGGKDYGAVDNGVNEKDVNLGVARNLASLIKKNLKGVNVVMTRDDDTFVSLEERANIANRNRGKLFISIHTNSVDKSNANRKNVSGASVYALGLHKDASNLKVAMRENSVIELESDYAQKYSGFDPSKDESYIIFEMAQKKNLEQSLKFANLAQRQLVSTAHRADRGVKQAGFWVLWATSMPAVLVELDFICNPDCAKYIGSDAGQEEMARALLNAVENYMSTYSGYGGASSAKPASGAKSAAKAPKKATGTKAAKAAAPVVNNEEPKERPEIAESSTPELPALPSVKREDVPPAANQSGSRISVPRRRRSAMAMESSNQRDLAIASIPVHTEDEYLAVVRTPKVETAPQEQAPIATDSKNKKKDKKQKAKKTSQNTRESGKYNNTKIVLSTATGEIHSEDIGSKGRTQQRAASAHRSKVERFETVYKIQILASADELKPGNPRFCNLTPIKAFKEDNLYKYTYGESTDRSEIEKLLKEVRKVIPDAFVITSKK